MILDRINDAVKSAMKSKNSRLVGVLRLVKSDIKYSQIELGKELTDHQVVAVLQKAVKAREQALELFRKGNRQDLIDQNEYEIEIIKGYLPKEPDIDDIKNTISEALFKLKASGMKDMGKVIQYVNEHFNGLADGKKISKLVKEKLLDL